MSARLTRLWPLALIALAFAALFLTGADAWLSLEALQRNEQALRGLVAEHRIAAVLLFMAVYAAVVTTYVPGAAILTLTGGFLFGTWLGGSATVVGATLGAIGAWWLIRTSLGEPLRARAEATGGLLQRLVRGFQGDAFAWVLSLRLIPAAPFWLVNAAAGLGSAPLRPYALATLLGILPATFIYAGIGAGLGALFRLGETPDLGVILQPRFALPLLGLALLSLLPAVWKRVRRRGGRG